MDLRQLRCFLAVAEELHFGRAAARLHIAGPAVSQTIRSLEQDLGLTLFERTNRRVALTAAGQVLRTEAQAVIDRFDAAQAAMARLRTGDIGQVRIGAVPALPPRLIPSLLARFAAKAPGVEVVVRAIPPARAAHDLLETTDVDVVLIRGEVSTPGVDACVVATEPVGVALPGSHALAAKPAITASDLTDIPLIAFARDGDATQHDRIFSGLAAAGLANPKIVHESHPGAVEASLRLVEAGVGLSLKLQSEVEAFDSPVIVWRPLADVELDVLVTAAWRRERATPALERLLPHLVDARRAEPTRPQAGHR
jgi:DNA-binding transcriptional LysR family regulator